MHAIKAAVLTIGDEILYGQITDTNTQWLSQELSTLGIQVVKKISIGDREPDILEAFTTLETSVSLVVVTGGLGPTKDDITKKTIVQFFDDQLVMDEKVEEHVRQFFEKRNRPFTDLNRMQALVPSKAHVLFNENGTAPGIWMESKGTVWIFMPGVPFEMKSIFSDYAIEKIKETFDLPVIYHKNIWTVGIGESFLAEKIESWESALPSHIKLAYLPSASMVRLRLTGFGEDKIQVEKEVLSQVYQLLPTIEEYVFGYDNDTLELVVGQWLQKVKKTIATAESCTGGQLAGLLTSIPGSSAYFKGSVVAYDNAIKASVLGVEQELLDQHGAVSEETVKAMAQGVRKVMGTDIGISTSGIAGPSGGTPEKPVGTIWIGYSDERRTVAKKLTLGQLRDINIRMTCIHALNMTRQILKYE